MEEEQYLNIGLKTNLPILVQERRIEATNNKIKPAYVAKNSC